MHTKMAYLQGPRFNREIYLRSSREKYTFGTLWKLERAVNGLTYSGRFWYFTSDSELVENFGLVKSKLYYTLYSSHDEKGHLDLVLTVQVDDYVYAGASNKIDAFERFLASTFDVREFERGNLTAMSCQ